MKEISKAIARFIDKADVGDVATLMFVGGMMAVALITVIASATGGLK